MFLFSDDLTAIDQIASLRETVFSPKVVALQAGEPFGVNVPVFESYPFAILSALALEADSSRGATVVFSRRFRRRVSS
jgi:hypothetical protein